MEPNEILDRTDACRTLKISRQTLMAWIRKGKLKVWKRVGHGSNAALLFERATIEALRAEGSGLRLHSPDQVAAGDY